MQGGNEIPLQLGVCSKRALDGWQVAPHDGVQQGQGSWRAVWRLARRHGLLCEEVPSLQALVRWLCGGRRQRWRRNVLG